jgi:hypothetical protein
MRQNKHDLCFINITLACKTISYFFREIIRVIYQILTKLPTYYILFSHHFRNQLIYPDDGGITFPRNVETYTLLDIKIRTPT